MKKYRIEIIDIAKALTIFCVIMGHTTGNLEKPLFRLVLYTFHMPLFFALAGMSIKPVPVIGIEQWKRFLYKNFLALMVPYFVWGLIYSQTTYDNIRYLVYGSWEALGEMNTLTSLWFLPCFFIAKIFVRLIINALNRFQPKNISKCCGVCAIPMFVIGFLLPHPQSGYIWCFDVAFVATGFILIGIAMKRTYLIVAQQKTIWLVVGTLVSILLFSAGTIFRSEVLELCIMCGAQYGNVFWFLYNAFSGSASILFLSMLIFRLSRESARPFSTKIITFIGQNTMGIYLLHKPLMQAVVMPFIVNLLGTSVPLVVHAAIASAIMLPVCCVLCKVVARYIPQLLGVFPRE